MEIAICDESEENRRQVRKLIEKCYREFTVNLEEYDNSEKLLRDAEQYDLIILDTEISGIDGISVKEKLQGSPKEIGVIFVSDQKEKMQKAFGINVHGFVEKSAVEKELPAILYRYVSEKHSGLELPEGIHSDDIEYISSEDIYVMCHLADLDRKLIRITLNDMEDRLREHGFFRIHREYLINMKYIVTVKRDTVQMRSGELPVAVRRRAEFKETYDKFRGGRSQCREAIQ